jgi:N6-adenosine-specific RNA methylase IME4
MTIELPRVAGGYGCVFGDPPWSFTDKGSRASPDWSGRQGGGYETMAADAIAALPVAEVVARDAHLYLWTTDAHLLDGSALRVVQAWGFTPKLTLDWVKVRPPREDPRVLVRDLASAWVTEMGLTTRRTRDDRRLIARVRRYLRAMEAPNAVIGGQLQVGLGHWYRHTHELVIFAVRGRAPALRHDLLTTFLAPRRRHSAKPWRLHELAEEMSPAPRLELFARERRQGWTCWGRECPEPARAA